MTERHEALTHSVELMRINSESDNEKIRALREAVELMRINSERDGEHIRALARIAEIHEHRLSASEQQADDHEERITDLEEPR